MLSRGGLSDEEVLVLASRLLGDVAYSMLTPAFGLEVLLYLTSEAQEQGVEH
jgi:hypothetical protein